MVSTKIYNMYKNLEYSLPKYSMAVIRDVYNSPDGFNGIENTYENLQSFYDNFIRNNGYKKLHDGNDKTETAFRITSYYCNKLVNYRKDLVYLTIIFLEDKIHKDYVPCIIVGTKKKGTLGCYVVASNGENIGLCILATIGNKSKDFYNIDKTLDS